MSYPSCIKIPASRNSTAPESRDRNCANDDASSYSELISTANRVFGHGCWSHSVTSQTVDFVEYVMGKYHIGCAAFVKVQLADGTFHEEMGYSNTESGAKGSAIYAARSSSITLALKKALLCFGGVIEESIEKIIPKTSRTKLREDNERSKENRMAEVSARNKKISGNGVKDGQSGETITIVKDSCEKKNVARHEQSVSTPKRNKSPLPKEPDDAFVAIATDVDVILADDCQNPTKIVADENSTTHKDAPSTAMTIEEMRLERKRKQKQKQEEYKKLMIEKVLKSDDKTNPRY